MRECPHIQELERLPESQLRQCSKIMGRNLQDVLKEHTGLINGIKSLALEVSQGEFEILPFLQPLDVLNTLKQILKSKPGISGTRVQVVSTATQTTLISEGTISTQTQADDRPPKSKDGSCQTNLNFSPSIRKIVQSKEVQTETIVPERSIVVQTDKVYYADASSSIADSVASESADKSSVIPSLMPVLDLADDNILDDNPLPGPSSNDVDRLALAAIKREVSNWMENPHNVFENFSDADERDDSRENLLLGSKSAETDSDAGQSNMLENDFPGRSDADLSETAVEDSPTSLQNETTRNTDESSLGNHSKRTISVNGLFTSRSIIKATKSRKKEDSSRNNNNLKKSGPTDSNNNPGIQVSTVQQVISSPPLEGVPPVQAWPLTASISKVRTKQKSGISKGRDEASDRDEVPVIENNSILTAVSLVTRNKIELKPGLSDRPVSKVKNLKEESQDKVLVNFSSRGRKRRLNGQIFQC